MPGLARYSAASTSGSFRCSTRVSSRLELALDARHALAQLPELLVHLVGLLLLEPFIHMFRQLPEPFVRLVGLLLEPFVRLVGLLLEPFVRLVGLLLEPFVRLVGLLLEPFVRLVGLLLEPFVHMFRQLPVLLVGLPEPVVRPFRQLPEPFVHMFRQLPVLLVGLPEPVVRPFRQLLEPFVHMFRQLPVLLVGLPEPVVRPPIPFVHAQCKGVNSAALLKNQPHNGNADAKRGSADAKNGDEFGRELSRETPPRFRKDERMRQVRAAQPSRRLPVRSAARISAASRLRRRSGEKARHLPETAPRNSEARPARRRRIRKP